MYSLALLECLILLIRSKLSTLLTSLILQYVDSLMPKRKPVPSLSKLTPKCIEVQCQTTTSFTTEFDEEREKRLGTDNFQAVPSDKAR
jgi:hypothetical protein